MLSMLTFTEVFGLQYFIDSHYQKIVERHVQFVHNQLKMYDHGVLLKSHHACVTFSIETPENEIIYNTLSSFLLVSARRSPSDASC